MITIPLKIFSIVRNKTEETENLIPEETLTEDPDTDSLTTDYVRDVKIREMSLACNRAIIDGFNITLHGREEHFSLSVGDQTNLSSAAVQILSGATEVPYHADGDEFKNFSSDDKIIEKANYHKTYHLAYFNCLKKWVSSLVRVKTIVGIQYGDEIPQRYQSAFFKSLIKEES